MYARAILTLDLTFSHTASGQTDLIHKEGNERDRTKSSLYSSTRSFKVSLNSILVGQSLLHQNLVIPEQIISIKSVPGRIDS